MIRHAACDITDRYFLCPTYANLTVYMTVMLGGRVAHLIFKYNRQQSTPNYKPVNMFYCIIPNRETDWRAWVCLIKLNKLQFTEKMCLVKVTNIPIYGYVNLQYSPVNDGQF